MNRLLLGRRILVTRPVAQAGVLARMLASLQAAGPVAGPVSLEAQGVFERVRAAHAGA